MAPGRPVDGVRVADRLDLRLASFRQRYRSDNLQSSNSKTLVLVRAEGKWKIQQERVGG